MVPPSEAWDEVAAEALVSVALNMVALGEEFWHMVALLPLVVEDSWNMVALVE